MKKLLILILLLAIGIVFSSCSDSTTTEPVVPDTGNLVVSSTPAGAKILLDGTDSGFSTPHTFSAKDVGTYTITLSLENYADTSMNAQVVKDQDAAINITLTPLYAEYNSVKIYETTGTTSAQPSGLILSTGTAISSTNTDIDIYYYSDNNTFEIRSSTNRSTKFYVGASSNLSDGVDSPVSSSTWTTSMNDREVNYVFLYDADGHYSKLKISNFGGGTIGDPAWVELSWIYNKAKDNILF